MFNFPQVLDVSWEMYEDIKLLMGNGNPFGDQIGEEFPVRVETSSAHPFLISFPSSLHRKTTLTPLLLGRDTWLV